ncbi:MAG: orotidine-5'-phosphate decarboxylase [Acidimicrobiia bacterium]|nr:orotidine-5'-phosphate decarboxylase [Acidimicrobiia bacterium]
MDALKPFLDRSDKGVFVLCRTSNEGAGEFQDLTDAGRTLYERVAENVANTWNLHGNCGLVVGSTHATELSRVRAIAPRVPVLLPGIGAQGGDLSAALEAGVDSMGSGIFVNASRSIIFASENDDFGAAAGAEARRLGIEITKALAR